MLTDKLYANCFFIRIYLDWLEHAKDSKFLVFKVIFYVKHIGRNPRFDPNDIGQKLGRLTDIWDIGQKLGTLGRHWADIGQTLGKYWACIGVLHISYNTFCISHVRDHPLKTSANFHDFWPLPPYRRQFFTTIRRQIREIFNPSPPKRCRRLKWMVPYRLWSFKTRDTK